MQDRDLMLAQLADVFEAEGDPRAGLLRAVTGDGAKGEIITAARNAESAPLRWARQYVHTLDRDKAHISELLNVIGPHPDPDTVDRIIGNKSWTRALCGECHKYVDVATTFGHDDPVTVCPACMAVALREMAAVLKPSEVVG